MRRHDKRTEPFYSTPGWRRTRAAALRRDKGLCVWCARAGRKRIDKSGRAWPVMAVLVHHVEPYQRRPDLALELDNLVSLCAACHEMAHPERHGARQARERPPTLAEQKGIRVERIVVEEVDEDGTQGAGAARGDGRGGDPALQRERSGA